MSPGGTGREQTEYPVEIPELSPERMDRTASLLGPCLRILQPKLYGIENLPADGSLLVGNHTIYGLLDVPFMTAEIWKRLYRFRTRRRCCDLRFGRMSWLRQDRGSWPFVCCT